MRPLLQSAQLALLALALTLLAACASTPPANPGAQTRDAHWQGRLAVKVYSKPVQAFAANFDLAGRADKGELLLTSPLGTTLARMQWDVGTATLSANGEQKTFGSLQELARKATGTDLPVTSLFAWLQGQNEKVPGWQVDLSDLSNGRLQAHHVEETEAELKIILDQ
jgi:outer membrane lipoprotein LolB